MMLGFRAYKLALVRTVKDGGHDEDGLPVEDRECLLPMSCHLVPQSQGSVVYADGKAWTCSFVAYLDVNCPVIKAGDRVRLYGTDGTELGAGVGFVVKRFHRYQTYAKLWV